jgi:Holliday junction resolvase RusA-like endonuclease
MKGAVITEDDLKRMQERVSGAVKAAAEPVRPILPARFTIIGDAAPVNNSKAQFVRDGKIHTRKTERGKVWADLAESQLREQWGIMLPVEVETYFIVDVFRPRNAGDVDGYAKGILDAFQAAGVIKNDSSIRRLTITKHVDRNRPRVEVVIYESNLKPL